MFFNFQDALWLLEPVLQAGIVFLMFRSGLFRRFPLFFSYNVFHAALQLVLYGVYHSRLGYEVYFYTFWSASPITLIFAFANVYELFGAMFRQRQGLKDFGTMLFRWAILVMLLMGLVLMASTAGLETHQFMKIVMSIERSIQLIMVGLLLFLLAFAVHLGVTWRHKAFGIIFGWGLLAAMELVLYTELARIAFYERTFNYVHFVAFNVMLLVWLCYVAVPE